MRSFKYFNTNVNKSKSDNLLDKAWIKQQTDNLFEQVA